MAAVWEEAPFSKMSAFQSQRWTTSLGWHPRYSSSSSTWFFCSLQILGTPKCFWGKQNKYAVKKNKKGKSKQLVDGAAAHISRRPSACQTTTWFHHVHAADPLRRLAQWLSASPLRGPECQSAELPCTQTVATSDAALISQPPRVAHPSQWHLCQTELLKRDGGGVAPPLQRSKHPGFDLAFTRSALQLGSRHQY